MIIKKLLHLLCRQVCQTKLEFHLSRLSATLMPFMPLYKKSGQPNFYLREIWGDTKLLKCPNVLQITLSKPSENKPGPILLGILTSLLYKCFLHIFKSNLEFSYQKSSCIQSSWWKKVGIPYNNNKILYLEDDDKNILWWCQNSLMCNLAWVV